jgi:hypothetical protein
VSAPKPPTDTQQRAAGDALAYDLSGKPGIKFVVDGREYELPRPLTTRFWLWLFLAAKDDFTSDDGMWFSLEIASRAEESVLWLTGLDAESFRSDEAQHKRVCDELIAQLGQEMNLARPFSPAALALEAIRRAGILATQSAPAGAGTPPASLSNATPAEVAGTK